MSDREAVRLANYAFQAHINDNEASVYWYLKRMTPAQAWWLKEKAERLMVLAAARLEETE